MFFFRFFRFLFLVFLKENGRVMLVSKFDKDRSNGSQDTGLERRALNLYKAVRHRGPCHFVTRHRGERTSVFTPRHKLTTSFMDGIFLIPFNFFLFFYFFCFFHFFLFFPFFFLFFLVLKASFRSCSSADSQASIERSQGHQDVEAGSESTQLGFDGAWLTKKTFGVKWAWTIIQPPFTAVYLRLTKVLTLLSNLHSIKKEGSQ